MTKFRRELEIVPNNQVTGAFEVEIRMAAACRQKWSILEQVVLTLPLGATLKAIAGELDDLALYHGVSLLEIEVSDSLLGMMVSQLTQKEGTPAITVGDLRNFLHYAALWANVPEEVLNIDLKEAGLANATWRSLLRAGEQTVKDVLTLYGIRGHFQGLTGIGVTKQAQLQESLEKLGIIFEKTEEA